MMRLYTLVEDRKMCILRCFYFFVTYDVKKGSFSAVFGRFLYVECVHMHAVNIFHQSSSIGIDIRTAEPKYITEHCSKEVK